MEERTCLAWSGGLLLLDTVSVGLGRGIGATATHKGDPSPISSALEEPLAGIPSSKGALASLGEFSKTS